MSGLEPQPCVCDSCSISTSTTPDLDPDLTDLDSERGENGGTDRKGLVNYPDISEPRPSSQASSSPNTRHSRHAISGQAIHVMSAESRAATGRS